MGQAREMQKLIYANWHAIYKMRKLIAVKLNSFTVCYDLQLMHFIYDSKFYAVVPVGVIRSVLLSYSDNDCANNIWASSWDYGTFHPL